MQASEPRDSTERDERLEVFPGLTEVRQRRLEARERLLSRRPRRRTRAAAHGLFLAGALGLIAAAAWRALPPGGEAVGGAVASSSSPAALAPVVETGPAPFTVVTTEETPSVELSPALARAIRRDCPGYRLRPAAAITTEALEELRLEHPEVRSPYAVSGDYDGDGHTDAALLLKKGSRALLIAFHAVPGGTYRGRVLARGRWVDGLYLLPQPPGAVEYTAAKDEAKATAATLTLSAPGIRFHPVEAAARVFFWRDGRYRSVEVGA